MDEQIPRQQPIPCPSPHTQAFNQSNISVALCGKRQKVWLDYCMNVHCYVVWNCYVGWNVLRCPACQKYTLICSVFLSYHVCEQGQGWSACFRHLSEAPPSTFIFLKCSHQSADRRRGKNDDQKGVLPPGISFSSSY